MGHPRECVAEENPKLRGYDETTDSDDSIIGAHSNRVGFVIWRAWLLGQSECVYKRHYDWTR